MDGSIKSSDEYKIHFPNMSVYAQEALKQNISLSQFLVDTLGLDDVVVEVIIANWNSDDIAKDLNSSVKNDDLEIENDDLIENKVKRILLKRNIVLLSMILWVPLVALIDYLFELELVTITAAILFFAIIGWQLFALYFIRCPRCHKSFFWSIFWANGFTNKCMNCGLR